MKEGDKCSLNKLDKTQKFTEPPSRYTEPSLIKELEANGIGRPSTYATTVNTIQKRKYVEKEKGKLIPEKLGFRVNDYLVASLPDLLNIGFTAEMENKLDGIENGQELWTEMLQKFYNEFSGWLELAKYKSAPAKGKVVQLLSLMNEITKWAPPEKFGKRTYNDKTFLSSIQKQFEKNKKLSEKQWDSTLKLAIKYSEQIPNLNEIAKEYSFQDDIKKMEEEIAVNEKERAKRQQDNKENAYILCKALKHFDSVNFPQPENDTAFSEKAFVESLQQRAKENKPLTPKQGKVLARIAINYKREINNFEELAALLSISSKDIQAANNKKEHASTSSQKSEIAGLLAHFENFKDWNEPTKKGKRIFDDKAFYLSLKDQFEKKNSLSYKQVAALKRIIAKYFKG